METPITKRRKALRWSPFILLALLAVGCCGYWLRFWSAGGQSPSKPASSRRPQAAPPSVPCDPDLAQFAADQQVRKYYPGLEWRSLDRLTLHDVDGEVCAYAVAFAKGDIGFHSAEGLRRHIREGWTELEKAKQVQAQADPNTEAAAQAKTRVTQTERSLYCFDDLATVITGGTTDSKLILRHFRGLPEFWVDAQMMDEEVALRRYGKALRVSGIVMVTPMDLRLVATGAGAPRLHSVDLRATERVAFPVDAHVLDTRNEKIWRLAEVKRARGAIEARKQQRYDTLGPAERTIYEKALKERTEALAAKWRQYRELWVEDQTRGGTNR